MKRWLYLIILIGLVCCKTQQEVVLPPTRLTVNLLDTNGNPIVTPVNVYLFTNVANYTNSSHYYRGINYLKNDTAVNGLCFFDSLSTGTPYYIYAHYKNYSGLNGGYYIDYDNEDKYVVDSLTKLVNGSSNTTINLTLSPANGLVSFWTPTANSPSLPITITLDNNLFGSITAPSATTPTYFDKTTVTALAPKGKHTLYAESPNGCVWTEELVVKGGGDYSIELYGCGSVNSNNTNGNGNVTFWVDSSNAASLPFTISINGDTVGILYNTSTFALPCFSAGGLTVSRPLGNYTSLAVSETNGCQLENNFTITSGSCTVVKLTSCEK